MRSRWSWLGLGMLLGLTVLSAWSAELDPAEVKRRMEIYMRDDPAGAKKSTPAPKPHPKPVVQPTVNYDHEAWKSAEKCGTAACFEAYLEDYPSGRYAKMARARLKTEPKPKPEPKPEPESRPAVVTEQPTLAARRSNQRFTDNNDGTVTDNKSGLIWLKKADCWNNRQTMSDAMASAQKLASGYCGLTDGSIAGQWRLPSKEDWETLIDPNARPALPAGHLFTGVYADNYWSSTTYRHSFLNENGLIAGLHVGQVGGAGKSYEGLVWPVRGGR